MSLLVGHVPTQLWLWFDLKVICFEEAVEPTVISSTKIRSGWSCLFKGDFQHHRETVSKRRNNNNNDNNNNNNNNNKNNNNKSNVDDDNNSNLLNFLAVNYWMDDSDYNKIK